MPPAPGRFSTTNARPSVFASCSEVSRPRMSVALPGVNGTITFTGLSGYACAAAEPEAASSAAARTARAFTLEPGIFRRIEPDQQAGAGLEHRPLDRARVLLEEGEGARFVQSGLLRVRDLAPGGPARVGELLPAHALRPFLELAGRHAVLLVVVELVRHLLCLEEGERLLHRVAVADAVDLHFASSFMARSKPLSVVGNMRPFISSLTMPIDWR